MSILAVGTVALDSVKTPFGERRDILGGSATFFSIAASFFAGTNIIAVVGDDFPKRHITLFRKRGIGTDGLSVAEGKTFRWKGYYEYDLNTAHTISTCLNVFKDFKPVVPRGLENSELLFLANTDPELQYDVLRQVRGPRLVAADSMNYWIDNKRKSLEKLLGRLDIFLANDGEARQFSGESNMMKAARCLLSFGPRAVIIKRGEYGVLYFSRHGHFSAPAYLLDTIRDPTGAGDTFAGGMMGCLGRAGRIDSASIRRAIVYGSIMASFAVEDFSVNKLLRISRKDIEKRCGKYREMTRI